MKKEEIVRRSIEKRVEKYTNEICHTASPDTWSYNFVYFVDRKRSGLSKEQRRNLCLEVLCSIEPHPFCDNISPSSASNVVIQEYLYLHQFKNIPHCNSVHIDANKATRPVFLKLAQLFNKSPINTLVVSTWKDIENFEVAQKILSSNVDVYIADEVDAPLHVFGPTPNDRVPSLDKSNGERHTWNIQQRLEEYCKNYSKGINKKNAEKIQKGKSNRRSLIQTVNEAVGQYYFQSVEQVAEYLVYLGKDLPGVGEWTMSSAVTRINDAFRLEDASKAKHQELDRSKLDRKFEKYGEYNQEQKEIRDNIFTEIEKIKAKEPVEKKPKKARRRKTPQT